MTAAGAAIGFRVVDGYRAEARAEKRRVVERIIAEEMEARGLSHQTRRE